MIMSSPPTLRSTPLVETQGDCGEVITQGDGSLVLTKVA